MPSGLSCTGLRRIVNSDRCAARSFTYVSWYTNVLSVSNLYNFSSSSVEAVRSGVLVPPDMKMRERHVGFGVRASCSGGSDPYFGRNEDVSDSSSPHIDSAKDGGGAEMLISVDNVEDLDSDNGNDDCRL